MPAGGDDADTGDVPRAGALEPKVVRVLAEVHELDDRRPGVNVQA